MPNRVLFFVRHGQYLSTAHEGEEPDGALTEVGQAQSALTAKRLQDYPIQVIHHSTLQRAVETADIIANAFPDVGKRPSPLLRECIPCVPEGMESHFAHIPPEFIAGGMVQAQQAFATYITPLIDGDSNQYEIVVSHGNLINAI
ncbi:MAG: hypothetical protein GY943_17640, partial [Chloroflexi bacterium]|nr:hypothetical protein [Chloroflexota bacterium]